MTIGIVITVATILALPMGVVLSKTYITTFSNEVSISLTGGKSN